MTTPPPRGRPGRADRGGLGAPRPRVLVVDDNPNKLLALEALLEPLGHPVVCAASGRAALRELLRGDFSVILLDVRMADMNGFETAAEIRRRPRSERTPIIFVTAFGEAEADMARAYALGAVDFVFSPIAPEILRNKVSVFIDLEEKTAEVRRQAEQVRRLETLQHRQRLEEAESGRREAEARFATILDIAGDAIITLDEHDHVLIFNRAAERIFERAANEAIGAPVGEFLDGVDAIEEENGAATSGVYRAVRGRRLSGSFPAEVSVSRAADGDSMLTTLILRDVTDRHEAEEGIRRLNAELGQRLRSGIAMVADLAATLDPESVLDRVLERAVFTVGADRGSLLIIDNARGVVARAHELHHLRPFATPLDLDSQPLIRRAVTERHPVIADPSSSDLLPAAADAWGRTPRHVAAVPMSDADVVVAVLLLARERAEPFATGDIEMLRLISDVALIAIRNANLFSQAMESSRAKGEFLNLAAHELRTPLSVISGYASMLRDGTFGTAPPGWSPPLEILNAKLGELSALVDDLLTAARTEAGRYPAQRDVIDLCAAALEAVERARPRAEMLDACMSVQSPHDAVLVEADPAQVGRILDNLINNALTYSTGPPEVRVLVTAEDASIAVEDRGPGIPGGQHERIFDRFVRVDHASVGPKPGTGLGLYIARALAAQQGGNLRLATTGDGGSTFALTLSPVRLETKTRAKPKAAGSLAASQA